MNSESETFQIQAIDAVIKRRKTEKVLADPAKPLPVRDFSMDLQELLELSAWAPFHKAADASHCQGALNAAMPWRFYTLDAANCRYLLETLKSWAEGDSSWLNGKIPNLLAAADVLIQATWLPNPAKEPQAGLFEANKDNMEHIAAAACAVQNLLLGATARDIPNYWASGGTLLRPEIHDLLGIPKQEIVLGSIFLFSGDTKDVTVALGAWRDKRGSLEGWARALHLEGS